MRVPGSGRGPPVPGSVRSPVCRGAASHGARAIPAAPGRLPETGRRTAATPRTFAHAAGTELVRKKDP